MWWPDYPALASDPTAEAPSTWDRRIQKASRKDKVSSMMAVGDVMTYPVVTVQESTPIREVARVLIDNGISGVPVVDPDGVILGVVSEAICS